MKVHAQRFLEVLFFVFIQLRERTIRAESSASTLRQSYLIDGVLNDVLAIDVQDEQRVDGIDACAEHRLKVVDERAANGLLHLQLTVVLKED